MFNYPKCKEWLKETMRNVAAAGYEITMSEHETQPVTVRYRFEGKKAMGEVVIWENGATSMMLYDLVLGKCSFSKHDVILVDSNYEALADFFKAVP
jgi:hypothetical protein